MSRSVFNGIIQFGLVSIPIKMYSSVRTEDIEFNSLCPNCKNRINEIVVCKNCNTTLDRKELLKGFKPSKSQPYVVFTQEEINSLKVKSSKTIEIEAFIDSNNIDSLMVEKSYYALPNKDFGAIKTYFLLNQVLSLTGKVGIGRITLRNRESICIIRAFKKGLIVSILYYPNEIVDIDELFEENGIRKEEVLEKELELSQLLVKKLENNVELNEFKDTYTEKLKEIINAKIENKPIVIEKVKEEVEATKGDLTEILEKSLKLKEQEK